MRNNSSSNKTIFYHIHPNPYEHFHFLNITLRHVSFNSFAIYKVWSHGLLWFKFLVSEDKNQEMSYTFDQRMASHGRKNNNYVPTNSIPSSSIIQLRYSIRRYQTQPKKVMPKLAAWMGVNDHELYKSSFCGLQYWGPPSATGKITGFDTKAIDMSVGRLLGPRDFAYRRV